FQTCKKLDRFETSCEPSRPQLQNLQPIGAMTFSNRSEQGKQQGSQGRLPPTCTKLSSIFATTGATWQPPKRLNLPHLPPMRHLNCSRIKTRSVINRIFMEKINSILITYIYLRKIV